MEENQLKDFLMMKIADEKTMIDKPNHAEYYKGRIDAFEYVLSCINERIFDVEIWDDFKPKNW